MNEWCAKTAVRNAMEESNCNTAPLSVHQFSENEEIPVEAWEKCVMDCIDLYNDLGDELLPFFQRAERELQSAKDRADSKEKTLVRMNRITVHNTTDRVAENTL